MRTPIAGLLAVAALCLLAAATADANTFSWSGEALIGTVANPFASTSSGAACQQAPGQTGTNYPGTQVEPWLAVNPANPQNKIAIWQQDRWSDGGANALVSAYTTDGGLSWNEDLAHQPAFTNCTGGTGDTGGYTRASDPWVTFGPDGTAWAMALQADIGFGPANAMSVARSGDGGATWDAPVLLRRDTSPNVLNDKNSLTADRYDARYVYAVWDRLEFPNASAAAKAGEHAIGYRGPTWFARRTAGGWEDAHVIYDPGGVNQTIGNQIVQTGTGTLVDGFALIYNFRNAGKARGYNVAVLRSSDHGATWSAPTRVANFAPGTVSDPTTGARVRTGDIIPEIAADPRAGSDTVYMVWQERGANGFSRIMFTSSPDAGRTWTTPEAVNAVTTTHAFTPSIDVASDGTVTITYDDFRNDTDAAPLWTDSWSLHRHPGDTGWSESHIGETFDLAQAAVARGYFLGDYEGLDAGDETDGSSVFSAARVVSGLHGPGSSETYGTTAVSSPGA